MKTKQFIKVLTLLLIVVNLTSLFFLDLLDSRIIRVILVFLILVYFLTFKYKDYLILGFIVTLLIADGLDVYYNYPKIPEFYAVVKISAYLLILYRTFSKIKFLKVKFRDFLLFGTIILLNLSIGIRSLFEVSHSISSQLELILLIIYGFMIVLVGTFVANYYFRYSSKRAFYFTTFVYLILFADISGYVANYFGIYGFHYFERIYYFISFMYMAYYMFFTDEKDDQESQLFDEAI